MHYVYCFSCKNDYSDANVNPPIKCGCCGSNRIGCYSEPNLLSKIINHYCENNDIRELDAAFYDATECGAHIAIMGCDERIYFLQNKEYPTNLNDITGIIIHTIVEGTYAEIEQKVRIDNSLEDFLESVKMLENEANDIFYQAEYDRIMNF